jgi:tRNA A-37 threonylcarbamoyl transferase component Bud32
MNVFDTSDMVRYIKIYSNHQRIFQNLFSRIHYKLDNLLEFMNSKSNRGGHYNADESRELIQLIKIIEDLKLNLKNTDYAISIDQIYEKYLAYCKIFLINSGGSPIPDDFKEFQLKKYEPIFTISSTSFSKKSGATLELKLIGEGSFAKVYKFQDDSLGTKYALKKLNQDASVRDQHRFVTEYKIMEGLHSPYVIEVYKFSSDKNEYIMELCDCTLESYINKNNSTLPLYVRKRIVEQVLYGLIYLHQKKIWHRDLSYNNILVKKYDEKVVGIKLSDFGLSKSDGSKYTKTDTTLKGTIKDPTLESLKEYGVINEIYVIGYIINFVFTGKKNLSNLNDKSNRTKEIVKKCTEYDTSDRYQSVKAILDDIEKL